MPSQTDQSLGSDRIYEDLREKILRLELKPGADLDEGAVSGRYGVSRTPVREALIRLRAEGLATSARGRGSRVASLDLQDLRAFFEGLDILQRSVSRLAAIRHNQSDLDLIERLMLDCETGAASLDNKMVNERNCAFHNAIGAAAHSRYLSASYARSLTEGLRIGYVCFSEHGRVDQTLSQHLDATMADHRDLFAAIRDRDADTAERVAGRHVKLFHNRVNTTILSIDITQEISTATGDLDP